MTPAKPSITGTTHTLPFDKLSEDDFERLCLWLVEREGFHSAEHLGASGSEQGRDVIAWRDKEQWAFQCKRVKRFGFKTAEEEIEKIRKFPESERPAKYVFIVSINVSDTTRRKVRAAYPDMEILFWVGTELDEKVKSHPEIVNEFFLAAEKSPPLVAVLKRNRGALGVIIALVLIFAAFIGVEMIWHPFQPRCQLEISQQVHIFEGKNVWPKPDVLSGSTPWRTTSRTLVYVIGGPKWGLISWEPRDKDWWWEVSDTVDGESLGWVYQNFLEECQ